MCERGRAVCEMCAAEMRKVGKVNHIIAHTLAPGCAGVNFSCTLRALNVLRATLLLKTSIISSSFPFCARAESERAGKMNIFCDSADLFSASFTSHACSKEIIKLGKESMFCFISLNIVAKGLLKFQKTVQFHLPIS
jgi:hypothetical protein